jgi:chitin synthase
MNNNPYGDPSRRDRDMPSVAGGSYSYRSSSGMPMPPPHHPPDAPSIYSQQLVPLPPDGYAMSVAGRSSAVGGGGGDDVSQLGDRTFESRARSIAGSAALVPKAKYSWASESLGTQSTVMTRRSLATASIPEPEMQRSSTAAAEGRMWASFAWIVTFMIPNKCIMRPTKDAKQAWREKVALFVIMVSCSVFFVGVFGFVPLLLCKEDTIFSLQDIWLQSGENWVVVHGLIYDVKDLINRHPGGVDGVVMFLGKDASKVFPRAPPVALPQKCLDMIKVEEYGLNIDTPTNNFTNPVCHDFTDLDVLLGITCHDFAAGSEGVNKFLGDFQRGELSHTTPGLNELGIKWFSLYDRVYDVTTYVDAINENAEPVVEGESQNYDAPEAYLTPTLNKVIMNSLQTDATDLYEALFGSEEYIACLEEMFYVGILDDEFDTFCYTLNIMMYVMLVFVAALMIIQFLASLMYVCPRNRTYTEEDVRSPVMVMVPCYNEGDNELRKTIKSVLNTTYPDENKVLFVVADGMVTGNGEDMSTPEHLANILGFDIDEFEDDTFEYECIGVTHTKNRARVYHGILQKGHKFLKYIVVVKCGLPAEATTSSKPGNRGKRDSQLITIGYFNRIHYGRELTELDSAIQRAMVDLNLQADMVRFLMAIDADTRVDTMSVTHMVFGMDKKEKVLALCGETKVDNKASSWVTVRVLYSRVYYWETAHCDPPPPPLEIVSLTESISLFLHPPIPPPQMIQVFEYYNSHHLKKAFEAAFGCVTCLPGCFTMYRIIADDGTPLLPGDPVLYEYSRNDIETLHEKNLYHLGEDRMLTTLLLKHFPDRSLTFIPEASCWTIVPHTFRILLSQRRRWINSTIHNMFELLRVNTMCGVCCISMKVVVAIDLIATMILPASFCYAVYLLFLVFFEDLPVSTVLLVLYAIIMGVQIVVFVLRSRWDYLWWFFIYFTVGLPVFYLILPVYSFWNMDDFSWGKTRAVGGNAPVGVPSADEENDDEDDENEKRKLKNYRRNDDDDDDEGTYERRDTDDRSGSYTRDTRKSRGTARRGEEEDSFEEGTYDSRTNNARSYRERGSNGSRGSRSSSGSRESRGSRQSQSRYYA